jgi:DNA-binding winged helix-turn-helix (wHTH) protein
VNVSLTQKFSFNQITVDPQANAIYLNGTEKRLEPKLISLLCLLAAQGHNVISRQEISAAIWPKVVIGEESITRAIFALRNALGDDAKQPQFIETIPKKGYRFLTEVKMFNEQLSVQSTEKNATISTRIWISASVSLIFVLLIAELWLWQTHGLSSLEIESVQPLNKMEGVEGGIQLNAEGKKLLFVHDDGKMNSILSRDLQGAKDTSWTQDNFLKSAPVWVDENTIAYIRWHENEYQLVRHYQGQTPEIIYRSVKPLIQLTIDKHNSEALFFLEVQNNALTELKSLNLHNGKLQNWRDSIADLPKKIGLLAYATEPNRLLMVKDVDEKPVLFSLELETKKFTWLNSHFNKINDIVAFNQHTLLVVGAIEKSQGIWLVDPDKPEQLVLRSSGSQEIVKAQIDLSRKIIYYANFEPNIDLHIVSTQSATVQELPELNSSGVDTFGVTSDNNQFIYFISNRTGYYEIWRYEVKTKSVKQISTLNALSVTCFTLSHKAKSIALGYRTDDLYVGIIDAETGKLQRQIKTPVHRFPLAWSYDDTALYVSEHQTAVNLFRYDAATLTPALLAEKSGLYVKDLDGKNLVYVDYTRHAMVEKNLVTHEEKILHDNIPNLANLNPGMIKLNKNNDGFYVARDVEGQHQIWLYSFTASNSKPVKVKDLPSGLWVVNIAEDGESFMATEPKLFSGDIMKMQIKHF